VSYRHDLDTLSVHLRTNLFFSERAKIVSPKIDKEIAELDAKIDRR
jgi:hypothetical protein